MILYRPNILAHSVNPRMADYGYCRIFSLYCAYVCCIVICIALYCVMTTMTCESVVIAPMQHFEARYEHSRRIVDLFTAFLVYIIIALMYEFRTSLVVLDLHVPCPDKRIRETPTVFTPIYTKIVLSPDSDSNPVQLFQANIMEHGLSIAGFKS